MKYPVLTMLAIVFCLFSCDRVKFPTEEQLGHGGGITCSGDTFYSDTSYQKQHLLVEEFTGHRCLQCPKGAEQLKELSEDNPGDLIVVGVHSGSWAELVENKGYVTDFRSEAGNYITEQRRVLDYPSAIFNRRETGSDIRSFWDQKISDFLHSDAHVNPRMQLNLRNVRCEEDDVNKLQVTGIANETLTGNFALVVYVIEDQIISMQKDGRLEAKGLSPDDPDYEHNHVLRASIGSPAGNVFIEEQLESGQRISLDFTFGAEDRGAGWKVQDLSFVALVIDLASGEVVQSEQIAFTGS